MKKFLTIMVASLVLAACAEDREPVEAAVDIDAGRVFAVNNCSACHAPDGRGMTDEIPNLAAQPAGYLVEAMNAYREGRRHHAALQGLFSGMKEADIRNIAAHFSGLPPLEPVPTAATDPNAYVEGAEIAAACTVCHGENGVSMTAGIPSLAGQQPIYLIVSTQEYASGNRGHAEKAAMLEGLDQVDIEKMAMFFAAQLPPVREPPPFGNASAGEPLTASCGGCHGARGVSHDPMVPSLAGQEPNYLVAAIKAYRSQERDHEDMVTDRSDEDIENIAAFYSVQQAGSALSLDGSVSELAAKCDRCHGPAAGSSTMAVPSLNGQNRDYLVRVMKQYRDDDRGSSMMHKMSSGYSDDMIEAIASYYASHPAN